MSEKKTQEIGEGVAAFLVAESAKKLSAVDRVAELEEEREALIACLNIYGDPILHKALDSAGLLMEGRDGP